MRDRLGRLPAGASVVVRALPAAAYRDHSGLTNDLDAALAGAINAPRRRAGRGGPRRPDAGRPAAVNRDRTDADRDGGRAAPTARSGSSGLVALWRRYGAVGVLRLVVVAYRRWVSPALPPRCRFHPTCSAYALQALETHGALRGLALTVWRLLRCHPFHPGGFDPVPPAPSRRHGATVTGAST
jgi:putative membrane protein insertion efficiency factor